ncbi:MFS transporter [Pseudomonas sp. Q12-87]|uniref:MFS transporter n=1 Tax=Pseudomonas sp. Q12-87 TaxID=177989 RepID=UPI00069D7CE5|nr:MFS transporter [Pseudomonas sp. Q12-87]
MTIANPHIAAPAQAAVEAAPLPIGSLFALALAAFVTILTEALPAGLLPQISEGLAISEALAGQLVTVYAIGSLLAAIPLTAATQGVRRRSLLLLAIAGFAVANTVTTLSTSYVLTIIARLLGGVSAGLLWALLAGYAARMVPEHQKGRAIAIAMVGAPLALSLGVPAGILLGNLIGWRMSFAIMSLFAVALMVWVRLKVPDFPGQAANKRFGLGHVVTLPGVRPVLLVVLSFVLAHNILFTYIAPFLGAAGLADRTERVLLVFGVASLVGIWIVGVLIDRHLRPLTLAGTCLFAIAALMLWGLSDSLVAVYIAAGAWGIAFGGAGTLFQTAIAKTGGEAADVAQSMLVTAWNLAIAGGGIIGGLLLDHRGVAVFAPVLVGLLLVTLVVVWSAKHHGFPAPSGEAPNAGKGPR